MPSKCDSDRYANSFLSHDIPVLHIETQYGRHTRTHDCSLSVAGRVQHFYGLKMELRVGSFVFFPLDVSLLIC